MPARALRISSLLFFLAFTAAIEAAPRRVGRLELVGYATLPTDMRFEDTLVGGLSGLAYEPASGLFWAICDDRSDHSPARLYRLRIDLADGRLDPGDATVVGVALLRDEHGELFELGTVDFEGIALGGESVFISSEGEAKVGNPPLVAEFSRDGRLLRRLPLPEAFVPSSPEQGVRDNQGFEALSMAPDGRTLFVGTEGALVQDGPEAAVGVPSLTRLRRIDLASGDERQALYPLAALSAAPEPADGLRVRGLVDLLALGDDQLLALEREYVAGHGFQIHLNELSIAGSGEVTKRLLLDLAETGLTIENVEGLAFGPQLPDGRASLILVSDNNFLAETQGSQFFAFAVDESSPPIAAIQGAGHRSPYEKQWLAGVAGMVTAVDKKPRASGFWLESAAPDDDPATSEGIFVVWPAQDLPAMGEAVRVNGQVEEAGQGLPVTRLAGHAVERVAGGTELPPPVALFRERTPPREVIDDDGMKLFDPASDALDFWESLEGMRVELPGGVVIGPTSEYGDLVLRPETVTDAAQTERGGVLLGERGPDLHRVLLGRRLAGELPALAVGARLDGPIVGIVDYAFNNYRVWPLTPPQAAAGPACGEAAKPAGRGELAIGSFNVENLAATSPAEKFAALAADVVEGLRAPAILALQEVQDDSGPADDGVVTSRGTLERLIAAIVAAGGPRYEPVWIDPEPGAEGGQPVGNIRVAYLLDLAQVRLPRRGQAGALDEVMIEGKKRKMQLVPNPGRVAPRSPAFTLSGTEGVRRSLALELGVGGKRLFLINNHISSKFADDRPFGAIQPPRTPTTALRIAQARELRAFAERVLTADPKALLFVLGDLNDLEWSEPLRHLAAPPFENLMLRLPVGQRYSFNFEGASQLIDHVIASPEAARRAEVEIVHLNADCPASERSSDHDAVVVRMRR